MRIVQQNPETDWRRVWQNLHNTGSTQMITAVWYLVVHDLVPTNLRLHKIHLAESPNCSNCGRLDTRLHRLCECGEGEQIWRWTQQRVAWVMRTTPNNIPVEWVLRPQFRIWPPQRNRAVLWMLAHMVWYRMQGRRRQSVLDYCDFMRRARWKTERQAGTRELLANYLVVL